MTKLIVGVNDFASEYPEIATEWDYEKNGTLKPCSITSGSKKEVWWICPKGHSYRADPGRRTCMKTGCPFCSNKKVLKGYNDLATTNPELVEDWCYEKNEILPDEICAGTGKLIYWKCHICGGEWKAKGADRRRGIGCPYCKNKRVGKGINDLATTNQVLAREWNYRKNRGLMPDMFVEGSKKQVWWSCAICGNEWKASIDDRNRGKGCPRCYKRMQTSFPEQAVYYYVSKNFPDAENGYRGFFHGTMELDIYIPSLHIGIEYDGQAWHHSIKVMEREKKKYSICKQNNILLIRIKERRDAEQNDNSDVVIYVEDHIDDAIKQLGQWIDGLLDIDTERDRKRIQSNYYTVLRNKSLKTERPELICEWDYQKNGELTPDMFLSKSPEKVWWKCHFGHEYQAAISHRTEGKGCPFCANQRVWPGFNDLATVYPELAAEWDYDKNGALLPNAITAKSGREVWWKCKEGHSWKAKPLHRQKGGCPYCGGKKVLKGYNDFETLNPEVALEWDYEKNKDKRPCDYTNGSNVKVFWLCKKCGYSWQAQIYSRSSKGTGCPRCSKGRAAQKLTMRVRCMETGMVYDSIKEAALAVGIDRRLISACFHRGRKTAGGYHWELLI